MKTAWLILACNLSAAEIQDLGVISPRRPILLGNASTRSDFVKYQIELLPNNQPTNIVKVTLTNDWLTASNLMQVPSGPGLMMVWTFYSDGDNSEVSKARYDLRRGRSPGPTLTPVELIDTNKTEISLTNEVRKIREHRTPPMPPPLPPGVYQGSPAVFNEKFAKVTNHIFRPLPNGTNRSYADAMDALADRAARGKRRSE